MPFWLISADVGREEASTLSRRILGRAAAREAAAPDLPLPFDARCVLTTRPDIGLRSCFAPAARWIWPPERDGEGARRILIRPAEGRVVIRQGERRIALKAREAAALALGADAEFVLAQQGRIDVIELDSVLLPPSADKDAGLMRVIPRANPGLQALSHYGALLLRGLLPLNSFALQALAKAHVHALVDAALSDREIAAPAASTDRRAGRLAAIKADIEARLERRDLGVEMIATLHGVSARAVQKLFESEGRTFSDYVLERRLDRAWHRLVTADGGGLTISAVAFEVGFGDLSYFNRCFRKRFSCQPSQVKAQAVGGEVGA
ncbi:helix-turn-helix transcriptional regulator [Bosea sp. CER48]|uniref:helix-turn-helix transcriptional regulator n=1 Tax=Bosea sp. CER48 TaxID=3377035 RepID=UPI0038230C70